MWIYKMHFMENGEFFEYDTYGGQGSGAAQKAFPYLESLLSFLEMSREETMLRLNQKNVQFKNCN